MSLQNKMNQAMAYIEDHLQDKIDYKTLASYMSVTENEFRRLFSFITQIPLSEYIRNRRLCQAGLDLKENMKIIDVAMAYGYESTTAFSRAFKRFYGLTPSQARHENLKFYPQLRFKVALMEDMMTDKNQKMSIIGGGQVTYTVALEEVASVLKTNENFWDLVDNDEIGTTALPKYGAFLSEDKLSLMGDLKDKKVLEIACGRGRSLAYVGKKKAELWGIDISAEQVRLASDYLESIGLKANIRQAAMEVACGLPLDYFDMVYSVYGIGWTNDLDKTLKLVASYLKPKGLFIFSWSHPIHKCVAVEGDDLTFKKSYFDESWYQVSRGGETFSLSDRKMSTYVNALFKAGFVIEQMIEETDKDLADRAATTFSRKAQVLPVTFVIKARKL